MNVGSIDSGELPNLKVLNKLTPALTQNQHHQYSIYLWAHHKMEAQWL